jgi:hypothetical protein
MGDDKLFRLSGRWSPGQVDLELAVESLTPEEPTPPGSIAPSISVTTEQLRPLLIASLGSLYVAAGVSPPPQVIWYDHDSEVLVHLDRTVVELEDGLVLMALTLEADQTGVGQLTVPLSIGSPQLAAGLVVVTESRPRGPAALVDRWGDAAIAAAWRALLDAAHFLALRAGVDTNGARLVPGAISSNGKSLSVVPQARHATDAVTGR